MFPPRDPLGDPNSLDLGIGDPPTAPPAPTYGEDPAAQKKRRLVQLAVAALAAGLGPGRGTGLLQGLGAANAQRQQDQQLRDQQARQAYTVQRQDYQTQQRDYEQEQQRRQQLVATNLDKLRTIAPTLKSKDEYDRYIDAFSSGLQGLGVRVPANYLRTAVPFVPPDGKKAATLAVESFLKNPANKALIADPERLKTLKLRYDSDGDGINEDVFFHEAAERGGVQFGRNPDGTVYTYPPDTTEDEKTTADGYFSDFLEIAQSEGKRITPELRIELRDKARRKAKEADDLGPDPTLQAIRELTLQNARNAPRNALPPAVQRRVDAKAKAFDAQPAVRRVQTLAEAVSFTKSLDPNTTNPADDQALIYAFAKAMDPDSVVREGEYATVQKYAQSWASSFGFNAQRIFSNTQFLTPQSRANMKATIEKRFAAGKGQYDNLRKSYASQINRIVGSNEGDDYLIDYAAGFPDGGVVNDAPDTAPQQWTRDPTTGKPVMVPR